MTLSWALGKGAPHSLPCPWKVHSTHCSHRGSHFQSCSLREWGVTGITWWSMWRNPATASLCSQRNPTHWIEDTCTCMFTPVFLTIGNVCVTFKVWRVGAESYPSGCSQDKPPTSVPLLINPATYQSGVFVVFFLQRLLALPDGGRFLEGNYTWPLNNTGLNGAVCTQAGWFPASRAACASLGFASLDSTNRGSETVFWVSQLQFLSRGLPATGW